MSETGLNNDNSTLGEESLESSVAVLGIDERNQPMVELSFITFEPASDGCLDGESDSTSDTHGEAQA